MKLHFPKDWLRKISKEDLDGDDVPIGPPLRLRELEAMTHASPPDENKTEFRLGMIATFGCGFGFVVLWFIQFFFTAAPQDHWMAWMNLAMGGALVLIGIFALISRKRDQDYRKKMVLEHEAYTAAQLKDRPTASTIH